ncbi:transcriptional initiation protein Tat [Haloferax namakaokahaiae]|uniref:Transcriptional initiation protein Tat n=1 Tax=Haloferax namakaokahaiae TaxID=1748331 RepID=A0ABD5ZE39_9EURY
MERRRLLGLVAVGLSTGCLGSLPSADGPRNPPEAPAGAPRQTPAVPDVRISTFDIEETEDGRLRVVGEVVNDAASERTANVRIRVVVGGEESVQTLEISIPAGETEPFEAVFETTFEEFSKGGDLDVSLV